MVKLLLFAPCERVIIGQEDSSVSLISLLTGITASLPFPPNQPIPENVVLPVRWYLLSVWQCEAEDIGSQFQQRVVLESSSGKELQAGDVTFNMSDPAHAVLRGVTQFHGFPLSGFGIYRAKLLRRQSNADEWTHVAEYPITVVRGPVIDIAKPSSSTDVDAQKTDPIM